MQLSVIVSTYNAEKWLEKALIGIKNQSFTDFELIIADDGSGPDTKKIIDIAAAGFPVKITHLWQEDNGFQKTKILNRAILAAKADYLVFIDGDCILRKDFLQSHFNNRKQGYFLSGGYFKLPLATSEFIKPEDILSQNCFDIEWLAKNGLPDSFKKNKLCCNSFFAGLMNFITPTKASWNGHNASGWKKDLLEVNGFNTQMGYGGEDRELGERLANKGIKSKQIRYSAICVHLDHPRSYINDTVWKQNNAIRKNTKKNKTIVCPNGIYPVEQVLKSVENQNKTVSDNLAATGHSS